MAMWRPPQRIRHTPQPGRWPTAEQAQSARLFSPTQIGPLALRARTWVPAMVPWRATEDGFASDNVLAWYERFARGRPAVIVVEATGIRDIPSGPLLRIGDDRFLPGLRQLVEIVRRASDGETRLSFNSSISCASGVARIPASSSSASCRSAIDIARRSA
jgi:hypothetical protein